MLDKTIESLTEPPGKTALEKYAELYKASITINNIADMPEPEEGYFVRMTDEPRTVIDEIDGTINIVMKVQLRKCL